MGKKFCYQEGVYSDSEFTIPLSDDGSVIYFGINGKRFLLNGHTGFFSDSFPLLTNDIIEALQNPSAKPFRSRIDLIQQYGNHFLNQLEKVITTTNSRGKKETKNPGQLSFQQRMSPNVFNVYVSQQCNLSCTYCYNQGGTFGKSPSAMSKETAGDVLSFISTTVKTEKYPTVTVNLYGGEPLMALEATTVLSRGLQKLNSINLKTQVRLNLSTNGTIYNSKIFKMYSENSTFSHVIISLDESKGVHDKNRPFANRHQKSSYQTVLINMKKITEAHVPVTVTCVVPYPFDFVRAAKELHGLGIQRLKLKPLIHHIYGRSSLPEVFENDFQTWKQNYIAYSDYHIEYLKNPSPAEHINRYSLVNKYATGLSTNGNAKSMLACGTGDMVAAISSDGKILPCEGFMGHKQFELGDVRTGFNEKKYNDFENWLIQEGQHRLDKSRCRGCYAQLICGGGCYAVSFDKTGELNPLDESACRFIRENIKIDLYYLSRLKESHPSIYFNITGESQRLKTY